MFEVLQAEKDVDVTRIRVKKPVRLHKSCVAFNIRFDKKKLLLQAPSMSLAYAPSEEYRGINEYVCLSLVGKRDAHAKFCSNFEAIYNAVLGKLTTLYPETFQGKKQIPCCVKKDPDDPEGKQIRARIQNAKALVTAFDANRHPIPLSALLKNDHVTVLVGVEYVWTSAQSYGLECRLLQVKKDDIAAGAASCCLLVSPDPPNSPPLTASCPLLPDKYARMRKAGVPDAAVQNCMVMDGVVPPSNPISAARGPRNAPPPPPPRPPPITPAMLAAGRGQIGSGGRGRGGGRAPPPPPPPPPPTAVTSNPKSSKPAGGGMMAVLSQIAKGGFSLRKKGQQQDEQHHTCNTNDKHSPPGEGTLVPSLADILGARNKLRTVRKDQLDADRQARNKQHEPHDTFPFLKDIRSHTFRLRPVTSSSTNK